MKILASLALICMIVVWHYPQNGSATTTFLARAKDKLSAARNAICRSREEFSNNPIGWLFFVDPLFAVADITFDLMERFVELWIQEKQELAIRRVFHFRPQSQEEKGDAAKAENIIKSLKFASYHVNNMCDLKEGIPDNEYDEIVDKIADSRGMPEDLVQSVKQARHSMSKSMFAVDTLHFKANNGSMVFGRVAVIRRGNVLDIAYSFNTVNYELISKDGNAENLEQFSESLGNEKDNEAKGKSAEGISMELMNDFKEFFHKQVIDEFGKNCEDLMVGVNHGEEKENE